MNKYEQLIEHIINDETDKARALFHTIVVEKSRDIYESLIDESDLEEVSGNEVDELVDEVTCDEEGMNEEESYGDTSDWNTDEEGEEGEEGEESEFDYDDNGIEDEHESEHGDIEDRVVDLEAAFDQLQAEFDALMAGEESEEEHSQVFGSDDEFGSNDSGEEFGSEDQQAFYESEEEEEEEEDLEETLVREYVEKVGDTGQKSEGGEVGKGGSATINKQNPLAKPNRMGGESLKFGQNSTKEVNGTTAQKGENNAYKKGQSELDLGKRNVNQPGGNGADKFYGKKEKASSAEGQTTSGKLAVNTKSEIGGKVR